VNNPNELNPGETVAQDSQALPIKWPLPPSWRACRAR